MVTCRRPQCASYHADCWSDCVTQHGCCAVAGCDEREGLRDLGQLSARRRLQHVIRNAARSLSDALTEESEERVRTAKTAGALDPEDLYGPNEGLLRLGVLSGALLGPFLAYLLGEQVHLWFVLLFPFGGVLGCGLAASLLLAGRVVRELLSGGRRQVVPAPGPAQPSGSSPK